MNTTTEQIKQLSSQISLLTSVLDTMNKQMAELKKTEELEQQQVEQQKPTQSWSFLPQSIKEVILDFNGILEEDTKQKFSHVEPLIITEKYLREIKQKQLAQPVLADLAIYHTSKHPGNFDVFLKGKHIMNVHVDSYNIKQGSGPIMRWYDDQWVDMDSFIQFIIRHYIDGEPLPNHDLDY